MGQDDRIRDSRDLQIQAKFLPSDRSQLSSMPATGWFHVVQLDK